MFWRTKKVEDVVKTFTKAIEDLDDITEIRTVELAELNSKLVEATEEKNKAVRIREKLEKMLE